MLLWLCIYLIAVELVEALVGLWLVHTTRFHRLGLRLMSMCVISSWAVPYFCKCSCDRRCGNWTCPNFHQQLEG